MIGRGKGHIKYRLRNASDFCFQKSLFNKASPIWFFAEYSESDCIIKAISSSPRVFRKNYTKRDPPATRRLGTSKLSDTHDPLCSFKSPLGFNCASAQATGELIALLSSAK